MNKVRACPLGTYVAYISISSTGGRFGSFGCSVESVLPNKAERTNHLHTQDSFGSNHGPCAHIQQVSGGGGGDSQFPLAALRTSSSGSELGPT